MTEPSAKLRILVVDDETVIADSLAAIFRLRGFDAVSLYSGEDAVSAAMQQAPAVLLTDISMAGMNGVQVAIWVSRACPNCRILLLSGQPDASGLLDQARKDGHEFEVLAKPVHPKAILDWLSSKGFD